MNQEAKSKPHQDSINSLKARHDIVSVISKTVELKKRGANFIGLCPFHSEKTPSFSVSPSKQTYHCFGCGEGGDVISFVQKTLGTSFQGALKFLGHEGKQELIPSIMAKRRQRERELKLIRRFRKWELRHSDELAILCRCYRKLFASIKTINDFDKIGGLYNDFPNLEYKLNVFISGTDEQKFSFTGENAEWLLT